MGRDPSVHSNPHFLSLPTAEFNLLHMILASPSSGTASWLFNVISGFCAQPLLGEELRLGNEMRQLGK